MAVVVLRAIGVACQAWTLILAANRLPIADTGIFSAIYAFWGLCKMLGPFGTDHIAVREISIAGGQNDTCLANAFCRLACINSVWLSFALTAATAIGLAAIVVIGNYPFTHAQTILIVFGTAPIVFSTVTASALLGYRRVILSQAIETLSLNLLIAALVSMSDLLGALTLSSLLACHFVAAVLTAGIYAAFIFPNAGDIDSPVLASQRKRFWIDSFQLWQALVLIGASIRAPTYISLALLGSSYTAVLEIAIRFGTLPTIFTSAVSTSFSPMLADLNKRNERKTFSEVLDHASWLALAPSVFAFLVALFLGRGLLNLSLPDAYAQAYVPLLIVSAATTINAGFGLSSTALLMTGHQGVVRSYSLIRLVVVTGLGILLSWQLGVEGLAVSMLLGFALADIGMAYYTRRWLTVAGPLSLNGLLSLIRVARRLGK